MLVSRSIGCGCHRRPGARRGAVAPAAAPARRAAPLHGCRAAALPPGKADGGTKDGSDEEFEGLLPEEDAEVPGTYFDALNRNTKLGKAVAAAVDELEHLNKMELESLSQADELLKKLGLKAGLFGEGGKPPAPKGGGKGEGAGASADG